MIENTTVKTVTTKKNSIELDDADIWELLRRARPELPEKKPDGMRIYFAVPGGGDWSNTDIGIDNKHPVYVEWTTEDRHGG